RRCAGQFRAGEPRREENSGGCRGGMGALGQADNLVPAGSGVRHGSHANSPGSRAGTGTVPSQHKDVSCPCCGHSARAVACERRSRINVGEAGGVRDADVTITRWATENRKSAALHGGAGALLPGGVTHDVRLAEPFPLAVARANGARKWDVDGHELTCYVMGHGSLLLGHSHPAVVAAVREQAGLSFHPGACHELESRWAELVVALVPCAEQVRFTSSGTEASLLALRVARAATGR